MTNQQLREYCEAEFENIEAVLHELHSVIDRKSFEFSIVELAAIATFLHNFYNGIENVLKRILSFKSVEIKDTSTWHKDLLRISSETGIITSDAYAALSSYMSFRHFFVHAYSFNLKWEDMKPLVEMIERVWAGFKSEVLDYINKSAT